MGFGVAFFCVWDRLSMTVPDRYENEKNLLKSAKSLNLDLVEDRKRLEELQVGFAYALGLFSVCNISPHRPTKRRKSPTVTHGNLLLKFTQRFAGIKMRLPTARQSAVRLTRRLRCARSEMQ
jgi:hypothetical protein